MNNNLVYYFASGVIVLQYLFALLLGKSLNLSYESTTIGILILFLLSCTKRIYMFETYLVWDELKKHINILLKYTILMTIFMLFSENKSELIKLYLLGSLYSIFTFIILKMIRKVFFHKLKKNLLIIGVGAEAKNLTRIIIENHFTMYSILGYLNITNNEENTLVDKNLVLGSEKDIELISKEIRIDEVIVAIPELSDYEMNEVIDKIESKVNRIKFIPKINKMYTFNPEIQDYDGVMLISAKNKILSRKRQIFKRSFDIFGGMVGLMLLGPLYLIYGRKIKKDGGPALFSHNRIGKNLEDFKMHKFRSMYIDAEERLEKMLEENEEIRQEFYTNFKLKNDPRITPTGKFLRKTSLDEFPQFLNVLKGEMSLVGPRPVVQKEVEMYYGTDTGKKVFQAKPGITGMWQANGRSDVEDYEERIALDMYYIRNWSIWLDIIILIKTVKNVIRKKGAY